MLVAILAGAFIGWIASIIMGTNAEMGAVANIIAGIVGSWIGGFISSAVFGVAYGLNFHAMSLLFGVIGACVAIAIVRAFTGGGRPILH